MSGRPIVPITISAPEEYLDAIQHKLADLDTSGRGILFIPDETVARTTESDEFESDEFVDELMEAMSVSAGGWCAPSAAIAPLVGAAPLQIPEVTVKRGGIPVGSAPPRPERTRTVDPAPEGAGPGHWEYALRAVDGEVVASHGLYGREPFRCREEALEQLSWFRGTLVRHWVPDVWEVAP